MQSRKRYHNLASTICLCGWKWYPSCNLGILWMMNDGYNNCDCLYEYEKGYMCSCQKREIEKNAKIEKKPQTFAFELSTSEVHNSVNIPLFGLVLVWLDRKSYLVYHSTHNPFLPSLTSMFLFIETTFIRVLYSS